MSVSIYFKGGEKMPKLSEVERVKVFSGANAEIFEGDRLKNLRVKTGADYVFEVGEKIFAANADAILYIAVG